MQRTLREEITIRNERESNVYRRCSDIEKGCEKICQESANPCDTYEKLKKLHKEAGGGCWANMISLWVSSLPSFRKRGSSVNEEIALRKKWAENASMMSRDIRRNCGKKCCESERPCDIYEMVKALHGENPGSWSGSLTE